MIARIAAPYMPTILARKDASSILVNGVVRSSGPHIFPKPFYFRGKQQISFNMKPFARLQAAPAPSVFTPALPSDIGPTVDLSQNILFTPSVHDINQWKLENCWFLGTLAAGEYFCPQQVSDLLKCSKDPATGAARFTANFKKAGATYPVMVDGNLGLPPNTCGTNAITGAIGACLLEKALAFARTGANTYASENWGSAAEACTWLGWSCVNTNLNQTALMATMANRMPAMAQTPSVVPSGLQLIGSHIYSIIGVIVDADGNVWVYLFNPWDIDGFDDDSNPNDGIIKLSWADFTRGFSFMTLVNGLPFHHLAGDVNNDGVVDILDLQQVSNHWQQQVTPWTNGDSNGDGIVDAKDLQAVAGEWQQVA